MVMVALHGAHFERNGSISVFWAVGDIWILEVYPVGLQY